LIDTGWSVGGAVVGEGHVEAVERNGNGAIEPDEIDELGRAFLSESADRPLIRQRGKNAAGNEA
jgi:hypothetical protein